jgi:hypothetical protein
MISLRLSLSDLIDRSLLTSGPREMQVQTEEMTRAACIYIRDVKRALELPYADCYIGLELATFASDDVTTRPSPAKHSSQINQHV